MAARGAQLRSTQKLEAFASEVAKSSLGFSIIRLHNAAIL
ncbi:MAG: DUF6886 family protein [Casimicrobium sp.]